MQYQSKLQQNRFQSREPFCFFSETLEVGENPDIETSDFSIDGCLKLGDLDYIEIVFRSFILPLLVVLGFETKESVDSESISMDY